MDRTGVLEPVVNRDEALHSPVTAGLLTAESVEAFRRGLAGARESAAALDDAQRIELIAALESLKHTAAAAQAAVTVAFADSQDAALAACDMERPQRSRSVGSQVALARRESPWRGSRHLGLAKALVREMPCTYTALQDGRISEWAATLVVQATACLSVADRAAVDAQLTSRFGSLSDGQVGKVARALAGQVDPASVVARARKAQSERRVTVRPAPDTMAYLTALLPVSEAVACFAALTRLTDGPRQAGDERGRGQVMADELVRLLTGIDPNAEGLPVEIQLIMGTDTMTGDGESSEAAARVATEGMTPVHIPARIARLLAMTGSAREQVGCTPDQQAWIRRLFTDPAGTVRDADPRRRGFTGALRALIIARDQTCTTPYCDAPIRQIDHLNRYTDGGPTTEENGRGTCVSCNAVKEVPGWRTERVPLPGPLAEYAVRLTTPTGHHYLHRPPPAIESMDCAQPRTTGPPGRRVGTVSATPSSTGRAPRSRLGGVRPPFGDAGRRPRPEWVPWKRIGIVETTRGVVPGRTEWIAQLAEVEVPQR